MLLTKRMILVLTLGYFLLPLDIIVFAVERRLIYGETGRLDQFDPYTIHEASAHRLSDLIFDSLVEITLQGNYEGNLAKSWQQSKDNTSVIFQLRNDVLWHSDKNTNEKFTAKDILTTLRLIKSPESEIPNKDRFNDIKAVEMLNEHAIKFTLTRAVIDPLKIFTFKVIPNHAVGHLTALKRNSDFAKNPVGTGPYQFVKTNAQGEILLKSNQKYFRNVPKIDNIILKSYADQSVMAQSLLFNSIDLITYVSPRDLLEVKGDKKLSTLPYDTLSFSFFALNNSRGILQDKRVRLAFSYFINRKEMLEAFFQNNGQLISGPFSPSSWAYNLDVKPIEYDLKHAQELLAAAGLFDHDGDGFVEDHNKNKINLVLAVPLSGESEMIKRLVLAVQSYSKKAGLNIELQFMDWLVWKEKVLGKHDYDITLASWSFDDATNITSLFHSNQARPWGNNFVLYKNQEVDELLTEAQLTNDFDIKRAIYQKLHVLLASDAPYIYLWTLKNHAAFHRRVAGIKIDPFTFFKYITYWHMENSDDKAN